MPEKVSGTVAEGGETVAVKVFQVPRIIVRGPLTSSTSAGVQGCIQACLSPSI